CASGRRLGDTGELVPRIEGEMELLVVRGAEPVIELRGIVVTEVRDVLARDLRRTGALLHDLAGDTAQLVVRPVRFDERHRLVRDIRVALGHEPGDVPGLNRDGLGSG